LVTSPNIPVDGHQFQFRQYVQHGRRIPVATVSTDAAVANPFEQLLYNLAQVTIPSDNIDGDYLRTPQRWDIA